LIPAGDLALVIDHDAELMHAAGAVVVVVEILLVRPQQAHGLLTSLLGEHHRFGHVVVIESATVTAADTRYADLDLVGA
jgi:hypothetical protein